MYQALIDVLSPLLASEQKDARRLFHGRGHLYEGLEHINIDWYPPLLLITAYDEIENITDLVTDIQTLDQQSQIQSVLLQERYKKGVPATQMAGNPIQACEVTEGPLRFEVHPGSQQNAGLFLDMRPLRQWLQANSHDLNVLNLFAYTCSLSVAALAGKARQVVNVDMSKTSIKWGEKNHLLNNQDLRSVKSIPHNLFRSWGRIKQFGRYDLIIIDPPSRQRGSFNVEKDYRTILKRLGKLCNKNAMIIASVNSPYLGMDFLTAQFSRFAPTATFLREMPPSPEFADKYPERGLKVGLFRMG